MNFKALSAEFIGTFALCFVGILAIYNLGPAGPAGLLGIALAHGLVIVCFGSALGAVSGGHFNPAVSFGLLVAGKMKFNDFVGYVVSQTLAGFAAAGLIPILFSQAGQQVVAKGTPAVGAGFTVTAALIAEMICTFFLVLVVFGTAVNRKAPKLGAVAIGLVIAACILAIGPISGCAINPARHLGPALLSGAMDNFWIYLAGPLVGGALAGLYGRFVDPEESEAAS
ncbi:MAG: aquaporin [Fimbriimonadaceae bacterium]|jgi:MIP family channel proteins|nr:aquaporin [Fimbriimonadaceae bacterium]